MASPVNAYQRALLRHFAERPEAVFCRQVGEHGETTLLWRDLEADCGRFAAAYRAARVRPGDQILIFLRHIPQLYGAFFGAMLTGAVPAFMPCSSPRQDAGLYWRSHQMLLGAIGPAAIVTDRPTLAEMRVAGLALAAARVILIEETVAATLMPVLVPETATALLQHSSGTTGLKKGVALGYAAIREQVESYARAIDLSKDDTIVSWLPLYHDMGLIACLILPAYFGAPIVHIDPFHWIGRPGSLFDEIVRARATLTWLPNFAFEHLTGTVGRRAASWDLSGVRAFINCSEPCKPATFDRFAAAFEPAGVRADQLQCCYAMAETVFAATQTPLGAGPPRRLELDPASLDRGGVPRLAPPGHGVTVLETGAVIEGLILSVHDENGAALSDGAVGEIGLAGPFLFSGYNFDPERTAERMHGGVYRSRDLGFLRDGRLYVLGRLDDLIIVNGRNLYAHEIEASVAQVHGVKPGRVAAVAWFDARIGSETLVIMAERAMVHGGSDSGGDSEIRRAITDRVQAEFNVVPRTVELLEFGQLIKTSSGKISRKENLARHAGAGARAVAATN